MPELSPDLSATEAAPVRVRECVLSRSDCLAVIATMDLGDGGWRCVAA